ncbi:hypothetical protein [Modestobacter sp. NPDC049651]|uniref:DUF4760 domain-containing protein n=1 Tax=unclassified Modestobacter TaxID=2643866 RepID=UPI0033F01D11
MSTSETASLAIALLALAVSLWTSRRSVRATQASQQLTVVKDLLVRRHQTDFEEALATLRAAAFTSDNDPRSGYDGLRPTDRQRAYLVTNYYDLLGKLVAHQIVDEDLVLGAYGHSVHWAWTALRPFVYAQRAKNRTEFNVYFEHLAQRARLRPAAEIHADLKLLRDPTISAAAESVDG